MDLAKKLIVGAKKAGADCVKFQKSHLPSKFAKEALSAPYNSKHSYGTTYGEHKTKLEFSEAQYKELMDFSKVNLYDFIFLISITTRYFCNRRKGFQ